MDQPTRVLTWDYTDTNIAEFQEACLKVYVQTAQKQEWQCYTCRTVPSAIISCDVSAVISNGTLIAQGWMNTTSLRSENMMDQYMEQMDTTYLLYGDKGVLASVLIVGTLAGIGITLGLGWALILTCIGLVFVTLIGFLKMGWTITILLIGLAIMLAYKMRN
jgi:hypothetical protein